MLDTSTSGPSAMESFKLIEILSDDSNFKNEVISLTTPLLLKFLSFPPSTLETLFSHPPTPPATTAPPQQLQRDFMIVVFRIVGNLHCFNESVCKAEDKGMFIRATVAEMAKCAHYTTTDKHAKHDIQPSHVVTNLNFLLKRLISEHQVYHLNTEELDLVTSFTHELQLALSLPIPVPTPTPTPSSLPVSDGNVLSPLVSHKRKHMDTLEVQ
jgi:hypothetical protein